MVGYCMVSGIGSGREDPNETCRAVRVCPMGNLSGVCGVTYQNGCPQHIVEARKSLRSYNSVGVQVA